MTNQRGYEPWPIDINRISRDAEEVFRDQSRHAGLDVAEFQSVAPISRLAEAVVCIANNAPPSKQAARMMPFDDAEAQLAYDVYDYALGDDQYCADAAQLQRRKLFLAQIGPMASCVERAAHDDTQNGVLNDRQIAAMRNLTAVLGGPRRDHALNAAVLRPLREELIDALIYNVWETKKYPVASVGNPLSMTNRNSDIIAGMSYYYPPDPAKRNAKSSWKVANQAKTFSPTFSLHNPFLLVKRYDRENFRSLNIRAHNQASRKLPSTIKQYEIADLATREDYFAISAARHFFVHAVRRKEALLNGIEMLLK